MTSGIPHDDWMEWGARLAPTLDGVHAAVIAAPDAETAANVALAIARVQGEKRRVAIADLVGEVAPLQALVTGDDPHGISDSFLYGVSLNKIARPIDESGSIFLMPSGTEAVALEAVYANERWRRLAAGFHQVGALLLVVAVPDVPGFADLCGYVGALLPVGDFRTPLPRGVPLLAPLATASPIVSQEAPAVEDDGLREAASRGRERRAREAAAQDKATRQRRMFIAIALLFAVALLVGTMWPRIVNLLPAPVAGMFGGTATDTLPAEPMVRVPAAVDSSANDTTQSDSASASPVIMSVANPQDSAAASRFAIYYTTANTREAAMPDERIRALPSVAMTPVADGAEQWYRLTIGAYTDRSEAEALLRRMRDEKLVNSGSIVRVPYALRLEDSVAADLAFGRIAAFARRGILAYALRQQDGRVTIYTGAFEFPRQATLLADSLRTTGIEPLLVLRTGRAF